MSEDILVRAKRVEYPDSALRILPELIAEVERLRNLPRADVAAYDRRIQEMAARIKELQDLIDKPPEEADWVADYHLLQSALDGPIIDAARKWHAAYRKAQNSNLMRAKEVERLRSENLDYSCIARDLDFDITKKARLIDAQHDGILRLRKRLAAKDARIKELEAELELCNRMAKEQIENSTFLLNGHIAKEERLEAAFLDAKAERNFVLSNPLGSHPTERMEKARQGAIEALERIRNGE